MALGPTAKPTKRADLIGERTTTKRMSQMAMLLRADANILAVLFDTNTGNTLANTALLLFELDPKNWDPTSSPKYSPIATMAQKTRRPHRMLMLQPNVLMPCVYIAPPWSSVSPSSERLPKQ